MKFKDGMSKNVDWPSGFGKSDLPDYPKVISWGRLNFKLDNHNVIRGQRTRREIYEGKPIWVTKYCNSISGEIKCLV